MTDEEHPDLREAQKRMARLAFQLVQKFGPRTAVCILAGPAVAIVEQHFGLRGYEYLNELAREMAGEGETPAPTVN